MVEITEVPDNAMLEESTDESPHVNLADVYPRDDKDLLSFLYRCKNKGAHVGLCPRCSVLIDRVAAENFQKLQLERGRAQWNKRDPRQRQSSQISPKTFVLSATAPQGTWLKPNMAAGPSIATGVIREAKGKAPMSYRLEVRSEKKSDIFENYMGKNPMSRTQWRRFQRKK